MKLLVLILIISVMGIVDAQKSSDLSDLEVRLVDLVQDKLPDWTHETIEPMQGSTDVAIHHWTSGKTVVSLTIIRHGSVEQATSGIREFAAHMNGRGEQPDGGEEQYSLPYHSSLVLRKRHFTVNIDATSTDDKDEKRLIKQFARYLADAIRDT